MSRAGRHVISTDDVPTPAAAAPVSVLSTAQGGTGQNSSSSTGTPQVAGGTWSFASFTQGSVVFVASTGLIAQDNANLFWDDSTNRLGIGTASPTQQLHVAGTARIDGAIVPSAVVGTPAQHALFRENVIKAWAYVGGGGTGTLQDSFNVTSSTRNSTGNYTVTWDRDFVNTTYVVVGNAIGNSAFIRVQSLAVGSVNVQTIRFDGTLQDTDFSIIAMGDQ